MIQSFLRKLADGLGIPNIRGRGRTMEKRYHEIRSQIRQAQQRTDSLRRLVINMRGQEEEDARG